MKLFFINRRGFGGLFFLWFLLSVGSFCFAQEVENGFEKKDVDVIQEQDELEEDSEIDLSKDDEAEKEDLIKKDEVKKESANSLGDFSNKKEQEQEKNVLEQTNKEEVSSEDSASVFKSDEEGKVENFKEDNVVEGIIKDKEEESKDLDVKGKEDQEDSEEGDLKYDNLFINEISIGDESFVKNDFVELYNHSSKTIDLEGFSLKKKTKGGTKSNLVSSGKFKGEIKSGEYFLIKNRSYQGSLESNISFSGSSYSISKNNRIYLYDNEGNLIDFVGWGECDKDCEEGLFKFNLLEGVGLARKSFKKSSKQEDCFDITSFVTPGKKNIFSSEVEYSSRIFFSEVLSNPEGTDKSNEIVELVNRGENDVDLGGWSLENGAGKRFKIKDVLIKRNSFAVLLIKNSSFIIRNSNEKLSLINPANEIVSQVFCEGSAVSGVSWGIDEEGEWSWNRSQTFGKKNSINQLPKIKVKNIKKAYRKVYVVFDASQSFDRDGDKLKFAWDFGDGHKSYLAETRHLFKKKGRYNVFLKVSDGYGTSVKNFKITVKSYPRRKIEFVEILPNPKGKDKGNEIIKLYNKSSKRINLKNFYLATGNANKKYSSLVKHKIKEDLFISAGGVIEIRNKSKLCAFSLLNKFGKVALLYPDGKSVDKMEYGKDKIADDEYYKKEAGVWKWKGKSTHLNESEDNIKEPTFTNRGELAIERIILGAFYDNNKMLCKNLDRVRLENWMEIENNPGKVLFSRYLKI